MFHGSRALSQSLLPVKTLCLKMPVDVLGGTAIKPVERHGMEAVMFFLYDKEKGKQSIINLYIYLSIYQSIYLYINLLISGLHKLHIYISDTVFHAACNLQGEDVDVAAVWIKLSIYIFISIYLSISDGVRIEN